MIREEEFLLLAAHSTHLVMKTELILKENGIGCRVIPLPSEISASCGLSVKTELKNLEEVKKTLKEESLELELYKVKKIGLKKNIEKID